MTKITAHKIVFQIGTCGGWLMAKSLDMCVSGQHFTPWRFFNEGRLEDDATFQMGEKCKVQQDFAPLPPPTQQPMVNIHYSVCCIGQFQFLTFSFPDSAAATISKSIHSFPSATTTPACSSSASSGPCSATT